MEPLTLPAEWPATLDCGVAGAPLQGEERSGDVAVFAPIARGGLAGLIDGLGHGDAAADAAEAAAEIVREFPEASAEELFERCHRALQNTRGAVMTLAWFDLERAELAWTGVGNVEARLMRGAVEASVPGGSALVFGGVVGYQLPRVRTVTAPLTPGDAVVMVTDGIDAAFSPALEAGGDAQTLAERIFEHHVKGTDDAMALVVRFHP